MKIKLLMLFVMLASVQGCNKDDSETVSNSNDQEVTQPGTGDGDDNSEGVEEDYLALLNQFRSIERQCSLSGGVMPAVGALDKEQVALGQVAKLHSDSMANNEQLDLSITEAQWRERLNAEGYDPELLKAVIPSDTSFTNFSDVLKYFSNQTPDAEAGCEALMTEGLVDLGVTKSSNEQHYWTILMAKEKEEGGNQPPVEEPDTDKMKELLVEINKARAVEQTCGSEVKPAAPPVVWDDRLELAAKLHTEDMTTNNFISHTGSDGSSPGQRTTRQGYLWAAVGENIAAGDSRAFIAVNDWLNSAGHCRNLMNPAYTEVGAAHIYDPSADYNHYWTLKLAHPNSADPGF